MKHRNRKLTSFAIFAVVAISLFSTSSVKMRGQTGVPEPHSYVDDWTYHRLVFSNPGTFAEASRNRTLDKWYTISNNVRYQMQLLKRSNPQRLLDESSSPAGRSDFSTVRNAGLDPASRLRPGKGNAIKKDWITGMGAGVAASSATATFTGYPGNFNTLVIKGLGNTLTVEGNISSGTSCSFSGNAATVNFNNENSNQTDTSGMATNLADVINISGCGSAVGVTASNPASSEIKITAVTAGTAGNSITLTDGFTNFSQTWSNTALTGGASATVQPNVFPAIWGASPTAASCTQDFAVYPTGSGGATGAANIVGYYEIYTGATGCTTAPSVYWAYNTGTGYAVTTSPVTSLDGTKVAFVQSNGTAAQLVVLNWAQTQASITNGTGTLVSMSTSITATSNISALDIGMQISDATNTACIPAGDTIAAFSGTTVTLAVATASGCAHTGDTLHLTAESLTTPGVPPTGTPSSCSTCMAVVSLSHNDTYSSPYYNYGDDSIYVGDDSGDIEKVANVFNGTPSAATAVNLGHTNPLASPVYDDGSGCIYVGDTSGYLYSVESDDAGSVCTSSTFGSAVHGTSSQLASAALAGIYDSPIVDSTESEVYVFVAGSAAIGNCSSGNNCVDEFAESFTTGSPSHSEPLGTGGAGYPLYAGSFDNLWYSSSNSTGNLYLVGGTGVTTGAILYRVSVSAGAINGVQSAVTGINTSTHPWPSPATEFCNDGTSDCTVNAAGTLTTSGTDYLFFSVSSSGLSGCTGSAGNGCVVAYKLSQTATTTSATGTTTNTSTTISAVSSAFSGYTGQQIYGAGIPFGAYIVSYSTSGGDHIVISQAATATATGVVLTVVPNPTLSGSGYPVTAAATNGCWATGGLVVDNSAGTAGASQIYFIDLNGAAAGGANGSSYTSTNCTAGAGPTIQAVQTSQSNP